MKTKCIVATLLLAVLTCSQLFALDEPENIWAIKSLSEPDDVLFLQAIRLKENSSKHGKAGEIGPYQMMPKTVRDAGGSDMLSAMFHLHWLKRNLKHRGVAVTVFNLAACWNAGLDRYTSGRAKPFSYQYAGDVECLFNALKR